MFALFLAGGLSTAGREYFPDGKLGSSQEWEPNEIIKLSC